MQKERERLEKLAQASPAAVDSWRVKKGSLIRVETGIEGLSYGVENIMLPALDSNYQASNKNPRTFRLRKWLSIYRVPLVHETII